MARRGQRVWAPAPPSPKLPDAREKQAIIAACEALVRDTLKPRDLPEVTPSAWNYAIDIHGAYAGGRYRFMVRYRSGFEHSTGQGFDSPFARIDCMGPDDGAAGGLGGDCGGAGHEGGRGALDRSDPRGA